MLDSLSLSSPLTTFRLTSTVVIWFLGLVGGLSPLWIASSPTVVSLLNMVAGGVFLAASLLHLLPDAANNQALQEWTCPENEQDGHEYNYDDDTDCDFPWAYFFFGVGFLLVLLLETFAHEVERIYGLGDNHHHDDNDDNDDNDEIDADDSAIILSPPPIPLPQPYDSRSRSSSLSESIPLILNTDSTTFYSGSSSTSHNHHHHNNNNPQHHHHPPKKQIINTLSNCDEDDENNEEDDAASSLLTVDCRKTIIAHMHIQSLLGTRSQRKSIDTDSIILVDNPLTPVAALVFIALSFHSIMEGLAMGAQLSPAWDIFAAIVAHKALAGFALGQELLSHQMSRQRLCTSIFVFAAMTPLGVMLGWWTTRLSSSPNGDDDDDDDVTESVASGMCVALAGGTFLFVAIMEIIPQEMQDKQMLGWKSAALLAGFGGFGILARWV